MANDILGLAQSHNNAKVSGDYQALAAKKIQDTQKQEGAATLKLLESATLAEPGSKGSRVNIKV